MRPAKIIAGLMLTLGVGFLLSGLYDQMMIHRYAAVHYADHKFRAEGLVIPVLIGAILGGGIYAFFNAKFGPAILLGSLGTFFAFWIWAIVRAGVGM